MNIRYGYIINKLNIRCKCVNNYIVIINYNWIINDAII